MVSSLMFALLVFFSDFFMRRWEGVRTETQVTSSSHPSASMRRKLERRTDRRADTSTALFHRFRGQKPTYGQSTFHRQLARILRGRDVCCWTRIVTYRHTSKLALAQPRFHRSLSSDSINLAFFLAYLPVPPRVRRTCRVPT